MSKVYILEKRQLGCDKRMHWFPGSVAHTQLVMVKYAKKMRTEAGETHLRIAVYTRRNIYRERSK